ncbi:MAG: hypothetical protein ACYDHE_10190 [Candidatus Acidiferrales bacterium]
MPQRATMGEQIIGYLRRSGWVSQSIDAVMPELSRWERHLRRRGIETIPMLGTRSWPPAEARAHNEINLLMRQASRDRDSAFEHHLRNLTAIRPYKP